MAKEIQLLINDSDLDKRFYKLDGIEINNQLDNSYLIGLTKKIPINWNNDNPLNIAIKTTPAIAAPKIIDNLENVTSYSNNSLTSVKHSSGLFALTTNGELCTVNKNYSIYINNISFDEGGNNLLRDLGVLSMDYIKLSTNIKLSTYLHQIGAEIKTGFNILNTSDDKESIFLIYISTDIEASDYPIMYGGSDSFWVNISSSTIECDNPISYNYTVGTTYEDFGKNKFTVDNYLYKIPLLGISNKSTIKGGVSKNAPNIYISSGILNCDPKTSNTLPKAIIPFLYYNESLPEGKEGFLVGYNMRDTKLPIQLSFVRNPNNLNYPDFIPYFYTLQDGRYEEYYYLNNAFISSNASTLFENKSATTIADYSNIIAPDSFTNIVTYGNNYDTLIVYYLNFKPKTKGLKLNVNLNKYNNEAGISNLIALVDVDDNRTVINSNTTIYISSKPIAREYQ